MPIATAVLVVEDDHLLRHSLGCWLSQEGYAVRTCEIGEQAIQSVQENAPQLVLLDIGLPDCDGLKVARVLQRHCAVPIIFLTARGGEDDAIAGLNLGAEDYVTKPFRLRELLARIQVVLRRRRLPADAAQDTMLRPSSSPFPGYILINRP
jgi:DNA-binding response OmpR family regulator